MKGAAMAGRKIELELPEELLGELGRIAEAMGIRNEIEAAMVGIAEWVSRRKAELDDRDPSRRYFVNEALDELLGKKKN
jgi:hypothetical protein